MPEVTPNGGPNEDEQPAPAASAPPGQPADASIITEEDARRALARQAERDRLNAAARDEQLRAFAESIPCTEDSALRRKLEALWNGLAQPPAAEPQALPQFSRIRFFHNERLIILNHPELDPVLTRWLAAAKERAGEATDPLAAAKRLEDFVRGTFFTGSLKRALKIPSPAFRALEQRLTESLLGEFIEIGHGTCRHNAACFQLGMQELGNSSRFVTGVHATMCIGDEKVEKHELHAWNEASIGGKDRLFDSTDRRRASEIKSLREILRDDVANSVKGAIARSLKTQIEEVERARCFVSGWRNHVLDIYLPGAGGHEIRALTRHDIPSLAKLL